MFRRAGFDRVTAVAGLLTAALSLTLVAAGPVYADAVTVSALRKSLVETSSELTSIVVDTSVPSGDLDAVDRLVVARVRSSISSVGGDVSRRLASDSYGVSVPDPDELVPLAMLRSVEGISREADLVEGAWPEPDAAGVDVAIDERVARSLGLGLGDVVPLTGRRDPSQTADARVVGLYRVDDRSSSFWTGDPTLRDGFTESSSFRTHAFVTSPDAVLAAGERVSVSWVVRPDLGSATMDDVIPLRRRVAALEDDVVDELAASFGDDTTRSPLEVATGLPGVLTRLDRALVVTQSSVLAITLQLSVLAGYALALVAGLVAESRTEEYAVLRARGASPAQLLRRSTGEALALTAPTALVAPLLATWLAAGVSRVSALARTGLTIDPRPIPSAYLAVAVAALGTVALLAWPTFRLARSVQRASEGARERSRSTVQRAGVDIAVALLAVVVIWQLGSLGEERAASIRGRFGVDPLLVIAPALGLFAGAFLALRVVPLVARTAERVAHRTASAVPALAGWQIARRPMHYARSALLLLMAVALGVFTTSYQSTWTRSQEEQATHATGADVVVEPNRRTNDSITDLHLRSAYEGVPGVRAAMPVIRRGAVLPNTEHRAAVIALDADVAGDVVLPGRSREVAPALERLADDRSSLPSVALPDGTTRIELALALTEEEEPEDDVPPPVLDAFVLVVVEDGNGLLHRVAAGPVSSSAGTTELVVDLTPAGPPGLPPAFPVGIVDIELRAEVPPDRSRTVRAVVASLDAIAGDGSRVGVDAAGWTFRRTSVGAVDELPGVADAGREQGELVAARILTGRARFGATVTFGIRPTGTPPPSSYGIVVSRAWFDANDRQLGDSLRLDGFTDRSAHIVGTIDGFPSVDPGTDVVLVDLPTLQAVTYELGALIPTVDTWWLDVSGDAGEAARRLEEEPYEVASAVVRDRLASALANDPPAVGTVGALGIGFVTAALLSVVGFLVAAAMSARGRAGEFALLRALGLTPRQLAAWTLLEQAALIVLSLVIGTAIGLGLAGVLLPVVSLTSEGGEVVPPVEVVYPWSSILVVQGTALAGLVAAVLGINLALRRLAVARQLRSGATG